MLPARQISPPSWMTDPRTEKLMRTLGAYEVPMQALFVGGCVRNTLLDKPVGDLDIATLHTPLEVIERLKGAGIRYLPTGLDHGTVTAIVDDMTFEITTLRKDIETDGRHAVIAFTTDWKVDAQRRDFTINTLLASMDGMIFDPTGEGLAALDTGRVVFVGKADERIREDYLRILRFFRFHAQYGRGEADANALAACREYAEKISTLSRERITQEFLKIIAVPDARRILDLMFAHDVLKDMAGKYQPETMEKLCGLQMRYDAAWPMPRLFVLSGQEPDYFERWLMLSNAQKKYLEMYGMSVDMLKTVSKKKVRELVYRMGNSMALQSYFLRLAKNDDYAPDLELVDIAKYWQAPEFPVKGADLIAAGKTPGPEMGKKLKEMEEAWIASDFSKVPKI